LKVSILIHWIGVNLEIPELVRLPHRLVDLLRCHVIHLLEQTGLRWHPWLRQHLMLHVRLRLNLLSLYRLHLKIILIIYIRNKSGAGFEVELV